MHAVIFNQQNVPGQPVISSNAVEHILLQIACGTDTSSLVTAVYLLPGLNQTRGAYFRRWLKPADFRTNRGKWAFTGQLEIPGSLPPEYRLIRMRLDGRPHLYPRQDSDIYGWIFRYERLEDHIALLFAHELHHYRRYHLNLHPGEGEQAANRWAFEQTAAAGFQISANRIRPKKSRRRKKRVMTLFDPYRDFRELKAGDALIIHTDPGGRYPGQQALVVRPIRTHSKRIVIRTGDGKEWRWPMQWLKPLPRDP